VINPDQKDSDGDGIGDACEVQQTVLQQLQSLIEANMATYQNMGYNGV